MNPAPSSATSGTERSETNRRRPIMRCFVCGSHRFRYLFSIAEHRLVRCNECNFMLLNPQPSDAELALLAPKFDSRTLGATEPKPAVDSARPDRAERLLDTLIAHTGSARGKALVLGDGAVLAAATRRGFAVTTPETSPATGAGIGGGIERTGRRTGEFDACILADVIESIRDPADFLQTIHDLLLPAGVILVSSTLLVGSRPMKLMPGRLSYFSRKSLESLMFSQGFRALTWSPTDNKSASISGRRADKKARPLLSIIIPAFNEAATFREAFARLLAHPFPGCDVEFLIVESNSTDGTRAIVNEYADLPQVRILLEDRPRGKGHAVRTALRACNGDFIAIQDADLEYDVDDYDALLEPLLANREAFVLGARHGGRSRKMRQFAGQPMTSGILNFGHWFFTTLLNVCLGVRLKDPFTMYKIFRRDCIHDLAFEANRFDFDWELVIKLIRKGYVPIEIPVNYRSRSFHEGKKVRVIRDPLSWFVALAKFRFQKLVPNAPAAKSDVSSSTPGSPH